MLDGGLKGENAYVCLSNNFWYVPACWRRRVRSAVLLRPSYFFLLRFRTTNYPNWYPFAAGDQDATFRFVIQLGQ